MRQVAEPRYAAGGMRVSPRSILAMHTRNQIGGASTNRYTLRRADAIELRGGIGVSPRSNIAVGGISGDWQPTGGE
jgi:hypothetical protein